MVTLDCTELSTREINRRLGALEEGARVRILHPDGRHNLAVGLERAIEVSIEGHGGYYYAGMNQQADVTIHGNAGPGVAENMMSGRVRVKGYASSAAGASAHGGLLIIEKQASIRCGIALKGGDIVVGGDVGNMCGFLAQVGHIVVCGDAGHGLGDSLYEAVIYVRGKIADLGADARIEKMQKADHQTLAKLLKEADIDLDPKSFQRVASAKTLYHFDAEKSQTH